MAVNLNVGLLGHVDSGKTSLAKALSEIQSTAAFDKNPQSQSRGITLDLGFSSYSIPTPEHLIGTVSVERIQYTLVDCPGHASLIKTIIGGAQIIDMMLLVIDITKGIQTQTAECFVIGEITCKKMIIVLNKIDLIEESKRSHTIEKMKKKLRMTLKSTIFSNVPIVSVCVNPHGEKEGLLSLIQEVAQYSSIPERKFEGPFLFAVDHCFAIKGQGTVMTGTVLQGSTAVNDIIDIPVLNTTKKIKSMQMFRKPVTSASQGDRVGICVTQFDPKLMERGIVCSPGGVKFVTCAIISLNRIKYFKQSINTKAKYHITVGHETAMATITLVSIKKDKYNDFNFDWEYEYRSSLDNDDVAADNSIYFMVLEFEKPVLATDNCTVIGSKLDIDIHANTCRIAFWGKLLQYSKEKDYKSLFLSKLKAYKMKVKTGMIDRILDDNTIIVKNMFKKETDFQCFVGLKVKMSTGENGVLESSFGQSGKVKVYFANGLNKGTIDLLKLNIRGKNSVDRNVERINVQLEFKKFIYDVNKRMHQ